MTTANKITIGRILLVPVFVLLLIYYAESGREIFRVFALVAFVLASAADAVDGYVARRFNQRSELGAMIDPLADKLLLVSAVILLCLRNPYLTRLPEWLAVIILSRDAFLVLGLGLLHYFAGTIKVRPRVVGKLATVLQMALVLWILLKWPDAAILWLAVAAATLTGASGLLYVFDGMRQLSAHPSSSPTSAKPPRQ
jgi:CDP-diacylglycerol--glycerol-3-phosphate 3-phosphatidyltransferase